MGTLPAAVNMPQAAAVHRTYPAAGRSSLAGADSFALAVDCCSTPEGGHMGLARAVRGQERICSRDAVAPVERRKVKRRRSRCRGPLKGWERGRRRSGLVGDTPAAAIVHGEAEWKGQSSCLRIEGKEGDFDGHGG